MRLGDGFKEADGDETTEVEALDSIWALESSGDLELSELPLPTPLLHRANLGSRPPPILHETLPLSFGALAADEETVPTIELERPRRWEESPDRRYTLQGPAPIPTPMPARPVLPPQSASTYASLERLAAIPGVAHAASYGFGLWTLFLVGAISAAAGAALTLWHLG